MMPHKPLNQQLIQIIRLPPHPPRTRLPKLRRQIVASEKLIHRCGLLAVVQVAALVVGDVGDEVEGAGGAGAGGGVVESG